MVNQKFIDEVEQNKLKFGMFEGVAIALVILFFNLDKYDRLELMEYYGDEYNLDGEEIACKICNKICEDKSDLENHMFTRHNEYC